MRGLFLSVFMLLSLGTIARENYILYHKEILRCEQQFLYFDHITAALKDYKAVFEKYKKPFAKDCFIALQLACYANDKNSAEYFFKQSFRNGVSWAAVILSPPVKMMLDADPVFNRKIEIIYKQEYPLYSKSINYPLRQKILKMKHIDDSLKARLTGTKGQEYIKRRKVYDDLLDSNTIEVARLTRQYGFLSDRMIGVADNTIKEIEKFANDYRYIYALRSLIDQLYFHHACRYFSNPDKLRAALEEGELLPAMYACIYEWAFLDLREGRKELALCTPVAEQCEFYNICPVMRFWNVEKDTALVDRCRAAIGMASIDHYKRRRNFQKETGVRLLYGTFDIY
jgi:hypothetical protein